MKKSLSVILLSSMLTSSCFITEMKENTENMHDLSQCMRNINSISMYKAMRSGASSETRNREWEELNGNDEMSKGMGDKLKHAAIYFKAYEHQLFSAESCAEKEADRNDMYLNATQEFNKVMSDLYTSVQDEFDENGNYKGNVLALTKVKRGGVRGKKNDLMSFFAAATAMHSEHHFQGTVRRRKGEKHTSKTMYQIIKTALEKDYNGKSTLVFEDELLAGYNKEMLVALVKARLNFISVLAIKYMTDKEQMTFGQKLKTLTDRFLNLVGIDVIDMEVPAVIEKANTSTTIKTVDYLEAALKVKSFLRTIGEEATLDEEVKEILSAIKIDTSKMSTQSKKAKSLAQIDNKLKALLD